MVDDGVVSVGFRLGDCGTSNFGGDLFRSTGTGGGGIRGVVTLAGADCFCLFPIDGINKDGD